MLNSRKTGFDAFYCEAGLGGAHEKGGVEGEIGRYRRNFLVPVPRTGSLAELNEQLADADVRDAQRHIEYRPDTVQAGFEGERRFLRPLPDDGFDTGTVLWPKADRYGRVSVGKCRYSVPARFIGQAVQVRLTANELVVMDGPRAAARHPRLARSGAEHLVLDHYLEILVRKPGALPGSAPLKQARADGTFTAAHEAYWAAARARLGSDSAGTRALIEVLLLHRRLPGVSVTAGITAALAAGTCSPDAVALEARRHADAARAAGAGGTVPVPPRPSRAAVITLPRRPGPLPGDDRAAPAVAAYDQLLRPAPAAGTGEGTS